MSLGNNSRVSSPSQLQTHAQMEYPVFDFVPIISCSFTGYQWEGPDPVFYSLAHQLFMHIDKIPLNLLLSSLGSPSFLSLSLCSRCSIPGALWPFDGLILVCQFLFCPGEFRTGHNTPAGSHQCWGAGFPLLTCCWCCSQRLPLLWGPITGSWSPWHPTGNPGSFLPRYFSMCCSPIWSTGMFLPMSSLGIFLLLKCMRFLFAHFCRLSGFPLNDGTTIWSVNCSFLFCVICKYADAIHRFRGVS